MPSDSHTPAEDRDQLAWLLLKLAQVAREETAALQPHILLLHIAAACLPPYVGGRIRGQMMRLAGLQVGKHTTILGMPRMYGSGAIRSRLVIGDHVMLNIGCLFDLSDTITIGANVSLGHEVMLLTTSHQIGGTSHRAAGLYTMPVTIGQGAWIGARAVILPGVTVGAGGIVAAGAIVTKDVPPHTLVAGVPARHLRHLQV